MRWARQVWALVWRDFVVELRTRESLSTMLLFALITLVIFDFAFDLRVDNVREVAPGALWVAFTFAGILGLSRSLARDQEQGALEGLGAAGQFTLGDNPLAVAWDGAVSSRAGYFARKEVSYGHVA